jgi:phospholipase D1/2
VKAKRKPRRVPWVKLALIALAFAALAAAWRYTPLAEWISVERVAGWARAMRAHPWAPVLLVALHTPATFIMFPRPVLTLVGVWAFGPWLGFAYAMLGILVATVVSYYAGRVLPFERVKRYVDDDKLDAIHEVMRHHGVLAVFAFSFVPAPPFVVQSLIAGALRISVWSYAIGSFLGMAPGMAATAFFSNEILRAFDEDASTSYWLIGVVVVSIVALSWFMRRWFVNQSSKVRAPHKPAPGPA